MIISVKGLKTKDQTGKEMHRVIDNYSRDLDTIFVRRNGKYIPFSSLPMNEAFDAVRKMPYRRDQVPTEVVARPEIIFRNRPLGIDCKKKAILISAYLKRRGIPYRLIASSRKRNRKIHHVYPQMNIAGVWHNMDATYNHYRAMEPKFTTKTEVLSR